MKDLDGPFSTQRCVLRPCEHCGKEHEFWQELWDCALFHALAGPDWHNPPEVK